MHYKRARKSGALKLKTFAERFWEKVTRYGPDDCWPWQGNRNEHGYGTFKVGDRMRVATHAAWFLTHGEWPPKGMFACHHCDNPACVNPRHLFLGTAADNAQDAKRKGRTRNRPMPGETHPNAVLTKSEVLKIRATARQAKQTQRAIAREYGISEQHVSDIVRGNRWRHL